MQKGILGIVFFLSGCFSIPGYESVSQDEDCTCPDEECPDTASGNDDEISNRDAGVYDSGNDESQDIPDKPDLEFVTVPGNAFYIGNINEQGPWYQVAVKTFWIMKHEVTVAEYGKCVLSGACTRPVDECDCMWSDIGNDYPVSCVSWKQAQEFCSWACDFCRLPSESEWEFAARNAGQGIPYPWGIDAPDCERVAKSGCGRGIATVCSKPDGNTEQGACDMLGNLSEWVEDDWHDNYSGIPDNGTAWIDMDNYYKVIRGASFMDNENALRTTYREKRIQYHRAPWTGFRCAY